MNAGKGTSSDSDNKRKQVRVTSVKSNNLSNAVKNLYMNAERADIHFVFGPNDERIAAHKYILAISSSVFDDLFNGSTPVADEMKIEDSNVEAFKMFLQFFYMMEVELSMEHIQSVMYLGKKYEIVECMKVCSTFLKENATTNEMCLGLQLAMHYEQSDLKEFFKLQIGLNATDVLKSQEFLTCEWNVLNEIVRIDELLCRESTLLIACINWARNACERNKLNANDKTNIRNQLKDAVFEIRFKQMSLLEFVQHLKMNPINPYSEEEMSEIMMIMANMSVNATNFNCLERLGLNGISSNLDYLKCNRIMEKIADYDVPNVISTIFSSDNQLSFDKFSVYLKPCGKYIGYNCAIFGE